MKDGGETARFANPAGERVADLSVLAGANIFTVNVVDDEDDGLCDGAHCSLREAINAANDNTGFTDTIEFDIPGDGPHRIRPESALPEITDPVVIDGTTEPNFAGSPIVVIDGRNAGDAHGFFILPAATAPYVAW